MRFRTDLIEWLDTDLKCEKSDDGADFDCIVISDINAGVIRDELNNGGPRWGWQGDLLMPMDYFHPMLLAQLKLVNAELKSLGVVLDDRWASMMPDETKGKKK